MTRKLVSNVHVEDADGVAHVFGPDDDVPAWAVKKITNKAAWDDGDDTDVEDVDDAEPRRRPGRPPKPVTEL